MERSKNPFRYDRLPDDSAFFDREAEVDRIVACIAGGENLLVLGERRMGKTSCLMRAARKAARDHAAVCFFADLRCYATMADVAQGLLRNATPALGSLGERTTSWIASTVKGLVLKPKAKASLDAGTGGPEAGLELALEIRTPDPAAQSRTLIDVLDALNTLAGRRKRPVAVILDEFTFLDEMGLGSDKASWQLRGTIQKHQNVTYILAGSTRHLIDKLHGPDGPFFGMFGRLSVGPIEPGRFAAWIDGRFAAAGVKPEKVGDACLRFAGNRTRDILQLARRAYDLAAPEGRCSEATVSSALASLVQDFDEEFFSVWAGLSPVKKTVLRAVAEASGKRSFTAPVIALYGLGSSPSVNQACRELMRIRSRSPNADNRPPLLVRAQGHPAVYSFDNPFFAAWVNRLVGAGP